MRLSFGLLSKLFVAVALLAALIGCGGGGGGSSTPKPDVRFFNASPDSNTLSFLLDSSVKANALGYLGSTPDFVTVSQADYDVFLRDDASTDILDAQAFGMALDKHYVMVSAGLVNFGTENLKRARIVPFEVDLKDPNGSKARLYIVHAFNRSVGFDTPAIDFQSPGDNPQYKITGINFAQVSQLTVDSGSQSFEARRTGTESIYASATQTLDAGGIYVVLVTGVEGEVGTKAPQLVFVKLN